MPVIIGFTGSAHQDQTDGILGIDSGDDGVGRGGVMRAPPGRKREGWRRRT
jgi:hypothetical protein